MRTLLSYTDFSGSNLRGAYFESIKLKHVTLDYLTRLDKKLNTKWHDRKLPKEQLPDLYRAFRLAYEHEQLHTQMDHYYMCECVSNRQFILWQKLRKRFTMRRLKDWAINFAWSTISGYGTKPMRTIVLGLFISAFYSFIYFFQGTPEQGSPYHTFLSAVYLSFTTYSTLGYGDLTYMNDRPWMRLVSTSEAWLGAVTIALFVVILARKLLRR